MANWLQRVLTPSPVGTKKAPLPVKRTQGQLALPNHPAPTHAVLPAASVIYGVAASGFFVIAVYFVLTGRWFTGALVLLPAACFLGFALHLIKTR